MTNPEADYGYFYINYKAQKPDQNYPIRLITLACGSPTENLSEWIEYYLNPLMEKIPHRLEDSSHFLRLIENYNKQRAGEATPPPVIHATWDIEAMFPNISNDLGLRACRRFLDKRDVLFPSTNCLIDAIQLTLEENIAKFDNIVVKQCNGTAMGPHHSCSYADIAIDYAIDMIVMSYEQNPLRNNIEFWGRFRDDVYSPWIGTEQKLLLFDHWVNQLNPSLSFKLLYSHIEVTSLDMKVYTDGNLVKTRITSKKFGSNLKI